MEDYMTKYDDVLGKAKECYHDGLSLSRSVKEVLEYIFPELKPIDDDEMLREIMRYIKEQGDKPSGLPNGRVSVANMLYWLEKQGGQKLFDYENANIQQNDFAPKSAMEAIKEEKVDNANKVEPKFKVGDWIFTEQIDNIINGPRKIKEVNDYGYVLDGIREIVLPFTSEHCMRLWTIADAKDGDVLIDKSNNREFPFIFKETKISDIKTDYLNPLVVLGYCGIGGAGFTKGSGWGDIANCTYYPATKEQQDILLQKMKDAGYEWNSEKLKLRKIEQKSVDEPKLKIEKDKCYVCIRELYDNYGTRAFTVGDIYHSTKDETLMPDNSNVPYEVKYCADHYFRLWNIKDAKPGDILWFYDGTIVIFKDLYNDTTFHSYCHIEDSMFSVSKEDCPDWWESEGFYPATTEQQDILLQKMKDAGYEWNAEKLELRKIEQTSAESLTIEPGKYYYCIKDYWSGGNKRASKGDIVQALRGMSMMALDSNEAAEYFRPVNSINQSE